MDDPMFDIDVHGVEETLDRLKELSRSIGREVAEILNAGAEHMQRKMEASLQETPGWEGTTIKLDAGTGDGDLTVTAPGKYGAEWGTDEESTEKNPALLMALHASLRGTQSLMTRRLTTLLDQPANGRVTGVRSQEWHSLFDDEESDA